MTVCIAALCERSKAIILAADREVGLPFVKGQLEGQKVRAIYRNWVALIAVTTLLRLTMSSAMLGTISRRQNQAAFTLRAPSKVWQMLFRKDAQNVRRLFTYRPVAGR